MITPTSLHAEHGLERQRRQDRQVGIRGLPAPTGAPLGLPRRDRLVREPHRHAAAPAQPLVVIAPVRDPALLFRDVMAAVLVQLEGQGGHPGVSRRAALLLQPGPGRHRPDPCNNAPWVRVIPWICGRASWGTGGPGILAVTRPGIFGSARVAPSSFSSERTEQGRLSRPIGGARAGAGSWRPTRLF